LIAAVSASSESRQMRLRLPFTVFAQHRIAAGEQLKALRISETIVSGASVPTP